MATLNITTGITLLAVEPGIILTRAIATFLHHQTRRFLFLSLRNARCLARQWTGERGLLLLPDELLTEVVTQLEWQDILHVRQTCQRLNFASRSLFVWRSIVERASPELLWLECPISTYSSNDLEFLFLRRKRAEVGYKMVSKGLAPRRQVIPLSLKDIAGPAHLVRGGRWLLLATYHGAIVYYDLEAESPVSRALTPEHEEGALISIAVDMDSTSPTLRFNLAVSRNFSIGRGDLRGVVEVWQVGLVLDGNNLGVGLHAERLASFDQEPPGRCRRISLLGEQIAMTIFYMSHSEVYTVCVAWRSVPGPDYPKRILHPSIEAMCLLHPDVLLSIQTDGIKLTSCLSLPEVTTVPRGSGYILQTWPFLTTLPFDSFFPSDLSARFLFPDSCRFLVCANHQVLAVVIRSQANGTYHIETFKVLDVPESLYDVQICVSGDFLTFWPQDGDVHLQQFSWEKNDATSFPAAKFTASPYYEPCFQLFDIISGRLLIPDAEGLALHDFTRFYSYLTSV
ncbi:hypothetical protein BDN72DRAFT_964789 [Pluteus cervinus]|uniref:Uncharacterized protein n=1 Tax=Pluteus cervinus TaxID=181527 RepID=A0ACD3A974_9AGAR|nr:hypothetical protein BDN72DRAFT_964789 [Pluteus cervinus]